MTREWPRVVLGALVLGALAVFVATNLRITTDITHFLPGGAPDGRVSLARQVAVGEISRTTIVLVELPAGAAPEHAAAVSRELEAALRAEPAAAGFAALEGSPPDGFDEALWRLYEPRRLAFAAPDAAAAKALLDDAGLAAAVDRLKRKLDSPMASLVARVAGRDPLLVLPALFERLSSRDDTLGLVENRFVTADGRGAVLFVTTTASSADTTAQRPVLAAIRAAFATVNARHGGTLTLQLCGSSRHALATEDASSDDIERVSMWSTIGLLLTFVALFSSLRLPLSWLPVLAAGFLVGSAACIVAFGQVHGMTMAFGASLIGVSIDYAVHFYCHQALAPAATPRATLRRLWPGLLLGCATTVLGFVVLLVATFPGLREMAWFAATGLSASLAAAWFFLPGLVGPIGSTRVSRAVVRGMVRATGLRGRARLVYLAPFVAVLVVTAIGLPRLRWNDSLSTLNRIDPALQAEDQRVVARVARVEQRRLVCTVGADDEATLAANERVATALTAAVQARELAGYRNIASVVPSAGTQRDVAAAMRADPTTWPRLESALRAAGFVPERFTAFRDTLAAPEPPPPLTLPEVAASPLGSLVRPFRMRLEDGRTAVFSYLHGLRDERAVAARVAAVPGAQLLDIEAVLAEAFGAYRERMTTLLVAGVLAVIAAVALRYRNARLIALAVVPAVVGAAGTVAVLTLLGLDISILSLVSLLMVVSMGVDYGIFLAEDRTHPEARGATQLGVVVDGLTTILGFGLLATSAQPALFSIGASAGIGVTLCLVLSLCFGAFVAPREAA